MQFQKQPDAHPEVFKAIIRGRVQGVSFRATTKKIADSLALQGTVRNLDDGSVEIILLGSRKTLEFLIQEVAKVISRDCLKEVFITPLSSPSSFSGFFIVI